MSTTDNGGPAFPFIDSASPLEHPGMTLRDYFAAKAMPSAIEYWAQKNAGGEGGNFVWQMHQASADCLGAAVLAYRMADAMIKVRQA